MKPISAQSDPVPEPAEPDLLDLETFLPYRLSVLSNRISNAIARVYAKRFGLSIPEWRLIAVLGRFGPLSANGVAFRTFMDKVRVSRAVQRLHGEWNGSDLSHGYCTGRRGDEVKRRHGRGIRECSCHLGCATGRKVPDLNIGGERCGGVKIAERGNSGDDPCWTPAGDCGGDSVDGDCVS